jgi:hypothetical protein
MNSTEDTRKGLLTERLRQHIHPSFKSLQLPEYVLRITNKNNNNNNTNVTNNTNINNRREIESTNLSGESHKSTTQAPPPQHNLRILLIEGTLTRSNIHKHSLPLNTRMHRHTPPRALTFASSSCSLLLSHR